MRDIDRDRFLGPEEAIEYGLADRVLHTREEAGLGDCVEQSLGRSAADARNAAIALGSCRVRVPSAASCSAAVGGDIAAETARGEHETRRLVDQLDQDARDRCRARRGHRRRIFCNSASSPC